jgi:sugar phosphate isomerase/epimerase
MNQPMNKYMKVGLIHFMAYPFAMKGEGDIVNTVKRICNDDYFDVVEVTLMNDPAVRAAVSKMVRESGITMTYGGQIRLLITKQNINSLDEAQRQIALANLKTGIDEAYELGCTGFAFLSGRYAEETKEQSYQVLVKSVVELCQYAKSKGDMPVNLEVFDYDIEKCALIGPAALAARLAEEVCGQVDNFGLMVDLSHVPQLHETIRESIVPVAKYIKHAHIGNAVLVPGAPAYGDQHPRFGFPNSVNGVDDLVEFLRVLFEIGYLNEESRKIVSFEIKPVGDEDPEMIIANAKRFLNEAWAKL